MSQFFLWICSIYIKQDTLSTCLNYRYYMQYKIMLLLSTFPETALYIRRQQIPLMKFEKIIHMFILNSLLTYTAVTTCTNDSFEHQIHISDSWSTEQLMRNWAIQLLCISPPSFFTEACRAPRKKCSENTSFLLFYLNPSQNNFCTSSSAHIVTIIPVMDGWIW